MHKLGTISTQNLLKFYVLEITQNAACNFLLQFIFFGNIHYNLFSGTGKYKIDLNTSSATVKTHYHCMSLPLLSLPRKANPNILIHTQVNQTEYGKLNFKVSPYHSHVHLWKNWIFIVYMLYYASIVSSYLIDPISEILNETIKDEKKWLALLGKSENT